MIQTVTIGSIVFNQENGNYFINELSGLEMPPIRVTNYNLAGEHFGLFVSAFYGNRRFSIRGTVVADSITDFISKRDTFQNEFSIISQLEKTVKFTLSNGRLVQIDAIPIALDFSPRAGEVLATDFNIAFDASFPFIVGQTEKNVNFSMPTGGGGKVPPDTMPMGLSGNSGGIIYTENAGNAIYYPLFRITGACSNFALKNVTTNKELRVNMTLSTGTYVDIDFKRKTIIDSSGANQYSKLSGNWWHIQAGSNELRFNADSFTDGETIANIKYRDSWLGI